MIALTHPDRSSAQNRFQGESQPASVGPATGVNSEFETKSQRFVNRLKSHDMRAFEVLVERCTPRLLAVAKRFLRNPDDAADAVQDTYLLAYVSIHKFRGASSVSTWLHRILVNACLMKLRSQSNDRSISFEMLTRNANVASADGLIESSTPGPACRLEDDELKSFVRDCIDELPDEYRTVILLRDIERMDTEQTASLLKISRGAVKTRLHRARQALRALIEAAFAGINDPRLIDRNPLQLLASN